ncbi:LacI family DNA-binding transcriptional regulator [Microbulbifer sp. S227A]|uniref:LacI family DNA-binding transcriptional regulator n=1 Tax=Microbulbifer sp. S227A TaxID=3415131 RepID=UPI003C7D86AD
MSGRVTIKDIASSLGVSVSTVGRALSGQDRISARTRRQILDEADRLGYVANSAARVMRAGHSNLIGLVIPEIENDANAAIARCVAESCAARGYQMVLFISSDDRDRELANIRALAEMRCAGAIVTLGPSPHRETIRLLSSMPVVQIMRHTSKLISDSITMDDRNGIAQAVRHLAELGHKRIGFVGGSDKLSTGVNRIVGFDAGLVGEGLVRDDALVITGPVRASFARKATEQLLNSENPPTAIVAAAVRLTIGVLETVNKFGLKVPDDISIIGYTDPLWLRGWGPGITTISIPVHEAGIAAASLLIQRIQDKGKKRAVASVYTPNLIVRNSTTVPRPHDRFLNRLG